MKNGNFFFLISVTLLLLVLPSVNATLQSDFEEITINEDIRFTNKNLVDSDFIIASDKVFYGSKEGQVSIELFLQNKVKSGFYKIGLETKSKSISLNSISINGSTRNLFLSPSKTFKDAVLFYLDSSTTKIILNISFNPDVIGLREEFDIVIYNSLGVEVARYDPFLSGFDFRQELTLDTNDINLSGNVTNDHTIWVHIKSDNTDFWTNHAFATANGITFTQSDELTELDFDVNGFDATNDDANIFVEYVETFDSVTDSTMWLYYGGSNTDNSDGSGAYPATYDAVWHMTETSGTLSSDSTSNNVTLTHSNSPDLTIFSPTGSATEYDSTAISENSTFTDGGFSVISMCFWYKRSSLDSLGDLITKHQADADNRYFFNSGNTGATTWRWEVANVTDTVTASKTDWDTDTFFHFCITADSDDNFMAMYVNGETTDGGTRSDPISAMPAGTSTDFQVGANSANTSSLDEVKVFVETELTNDEVRLIYNSDNDNLITFGAQETAFRAGFNFSLNPNGLDPENGLNSVIVTLTDTSTADVPAITDWNYFIDGVQFFHSTVNGNTTREITTLGDFNISLIIMGDGNVSQKDANVSVSTLVQNVDINFSLNTFSASNADVNFGVTFTEDANVFNWGFPGDQNQIARNINKTFSEDGTKTVCVTITNLSDANKTVCENFLVGRVLTRIPQDAETFVKLTTFDIDTSDVPIQSYSSLSADTNVFFFDDSTSFNASVAVDFNSDYFGTSRTFAFNSSFFDYQPFLVANDGTNLEATIFTINNPKGRVTVSGIRIDSFTDINGTSTLVESKFSDGTGQAIFHFVKGQEYTLDFYDVAGVLIMSQTIEANDTVYFAYLELGALSLIPTTVMIVAINWNPILGNVVADPDGNVSFWQLLRPQNGTIGDVNVFISHISDSNIIYSQVFTVNSSIDFNLSFDLNVAGFNDSFPLKVNLQIFDDNSVQVGSVRTNSYGFKDSGFKLATERAKDALGQFGVILVSLIITVALIGYGTSRAVGEDTNMFVIPTMFLTGIFFFIGWIPFDIWSSGVMFGIGLGLWSVKK